MRIHELFDHPAVWGPGGYFRLEEEDRRYYRDLEALLATTERGGFGLEQQAADRALHRKLREHRKEGELLVLESEDVERMRTLLELFVLLPGSERRLNQALDRRVARRRAGAAA